MNVKSVTYTPCVPMVTADVNLDTMEMGISARKVSKFCQRRETIVSHVN